jgi:hypothetical protein
VAIFLFYRSYFDEKKEAAVAPAAENTATIEEASEEQTETQNDSAN